MHIPKIQQVIDSGCRLPLSGMEKSLYGANKKVQKLSDKFQKELLRIRFGTLTLNDLSELIYKTIGTKDVNLNVVPLKRDNCMACVYTNAKLYANDDLISKYMISHHSFTMELNVNSGFVNNTNGEIVHEFRHLLDKLCIPKYNLMKSFDPSKNEEYLEKRKKIHDFILQPDEYKPKRILGLIKIHSFKKELKEKFSDLNNEQLINILQQFRYQVQMERNAYGDYIKYYSRTIPQKISQLFKVLCYQLSYRKSFEFAEKERALTEILKELIQEERTKIKLA